MQEELAKAQAKGQILENEELGEEQELEEEILGNHQKYLLSRQTKKKSSESHTVNKIMII